ncbi:MAG: hypothetical protein MRK01_08920 [Candidatus Scalindua sp.]|nr:hypothetical protein [Candidatus Scalindua sp.]
MKIKLKKIIGVSVILLTVAFSTLGNADAAGFSRDDYSYGTTDGVIGSNTTGGGTTVYKDNDGPIVPSRWQPIPFRRTPVYTIRLHAIATANSDGSDASPYTASKLQSKISAINDIFYEAGIEFEFDPATDFEQKNATILNKYFTLLADVEDYTDPNVEPPTTSVWHKAFRRAVANTHRGKLVLYFSSPDKLVYDEGLGHWTVTGAGNGGSSSGTGRWVSMKGNPGSPDLAHEIGHYLHQVHPFVGGVLNVEDAAARIKKAVDNGMAKNDGLDALDGDRAYVLDTPADAMGSIWVEEYGDKCTPNYSFIDIPVDFGSSSKTYRLEPDRGIVMSYFKGCGFDNHFSPQQIDRMRDALENMNRHDLISPQSSANMTLQRRGSAEAGSIDDVHLVRIGHRRLVTVSVANNQMKLIPWSVSTDGNTVQRLQGSAQAGPVSQIAALHTGLGNIVTAVRDGSGNLKLITWKVSSNGSVQRLHDATAGAVSSIAATRWDRLHVVTAVRTSTGVLKVIAWRVYADGSIHRLADATAGLVSLVDVTPNPWGVSTTVRDSVGNLKVIAWKVVRENGSWQVQRQGSYSAGSVSRLTATALDFDYLMVSAVRTTSGDQKVIAWDVNDVGTVRRLGSAVSAGGCGLLDSERLGVGTLVTACQDPSTKALKMSLFEVSPDGATIQLRSEAFAGGISALDLARTGDDMLVSAVRTNSGNLKLIVWDLQQ